VAEDKKKMKKICCGKLSTGTQWPVSHQMTQFRTQPNAGMGSLFCFWLLCSAPISPEKAVWILYRSAPNPLKHTRWNDNQVIAASARCRLNTSVSDCGVYDYSHHSKLLYAK